MFVVFFFIVHSYVCIPSSGYNNDYTAMALRTAMHTRYAVGVYNSSIMVDWVISLANKTASSVFEMFVVLTNIHVLN